MMIQVILLLFILFALSRVVMRVRAKDVRPLAAVFWVVFWIVAGIAVINPQSTMVAANFLGVGRGADLVFYISLALLFYFVFRIFIRLERIERDITKIVEAVALKEKK